MAIIEAREGLNDDLNREELEIDFEVLRPTTLRELEAYVAFCLSLAKKAKKPYSKLNWLLRPAVKCASSNTIYSTQE